MDKFYTLKEDIKTLCCTCSLPRGTEWEIIEQKSPNRIMVANKEGIVHKVKLSAFKRVTDYGR